MRQNERHLHWHDVKSRIVVVTVTHALTLPTCYHGNTSCIVEAINTVLSNNSYSNRQSTELTKAFESGVDIN